MTKTLEIKQSGCIGWTAGETDDTQNIGTGLGGLHRLDFVVEQTGENEGGELPQIELIVDEQPFPLLDGFGSGGIGSTHNGSICFTGNSAALHVVPGTAVNGKITFKLS